MVTVRSESGSQNRDSELKRGLKGSGIRTVEWGDAGLGRVLSVVEVAHNTLSLSPQTLFLCPNTLERRFLVPCARARTHPLTQLLRTPALLQRESVVYWYLIQ